MKRLITILATLVLLACPLTVGAQGYSATPVTVSKEKVKLNGKIYLSHVVLERQTIFGICKAYGVTEEELYAANPSLKQTGLQKNAILLVPYKEAAVTEVKDSREDEVKGYIEHTVRWYEDIDDIARTYGVTVKEIIEFNGLKNRKLSTRQVLRIPMKQVEIPGQAGNDGAVAAAAGEAAVATEIIAVAEPEPEGRLGFAVDTVCIVPGHMDTVSFLHYSPRDNVEFSLVLPLKSNEFNMDFYSGVLMAVKDAEQEGIKVKLNVYDLAAGMPSVEALCKGDFVLGPVASRDIEAVLQRVEGQVPLVSPLDQKAAGLTINYHNFIQAPTATDCQYEDLVQWVEQDMRDGDKLLFVSEKGAANVSASVAIRSALAHREMEYEILSYAIVEGVGIPAILTEQMVEGGTNRVLVASESEAFVGDVVRNLGIMLGKGYDVVMYAPSKVRTFDTIEGSDYHDARLHISSSYYVDYNSAEVDRFVRSYRALFQTEPSQFAFQGYDTARYFMGRVTTFGSGWARCLNLERKRGLHTDFFFKYDQHGNAANQAVRRVLFRKDYTTTLEK